MVQMEIRVTVDNEDKIVKGLTPETSVAEIIVALADTIGRRGRFSLVRKNGSSEKVLTPTDKIVEILKKKGRSKDVSFSMIRTSELDGEGTVKPERSPKRKSLPPKLKRRPKPTDSSSSISSKHESSENGSIHHRHHHERVRPASALGTTTSSSNNSNSLDRTAYRSKRNLIPSTDTSSLSSSSAVSSRFNGGGTSTFQRPPSRTGKPEHHRNDDAPVSSSSRTNVSNKIAAFDARSGSQSSDKRSSAAPDSSSSHGSVVRRRPRTPTSSLPRQRRPVSASSNEYKSASLRKEANAAHIENFTKLVTAQHEHLQEYKKALNTLDKELQKAELSWKNRVELPEVRGKDLESIHLEMKILEETIANNDETLRSEQALLDRMNADEEQALTMQMEISKIKSDSSIADRNLQEAKQRIQILENEITQERRQQQLRKKKAVSDGLKLELRKLNVESNRLNEMMRTTQKGIDDLDAGIREKNALLESLNRELRQVSLQQFICETGTKVTVLPPEEDTKKLRGILRMPRLKEQTQQEETSGGYWV